MGLFQPFIAFKQHKIGLVRMNDMRFQRFVPDLEYNVIKERKVLIQYRIWHNAKSLALECDMPCGGKIWWCS